MSKAKVKPTPRAIIFAGPNGAGKTTPEDGILAKLEIKAFVTADFTADKDHNMEKTKKAPQNLLTPSPKELQKALAQSAKQAEALAAAYGVKVPYSRAAVAQTAPAQRHR